MTYLRERLPGGHRLLGQIDAWSGTRPALCPFVPGRWRVPVRGAARAGGAN